MQSCVSHFHICTHCYVRLLFMNKVVENTDLPGVSKACSSCANVCLADRASRTISHNIISELAGFHSSHSTCSCHTCMDMLVWHLLPSLMEEEVVKTVQVLYSHTHVPARAVILCIAKVQLKQSAPVSDVPACHLGQQRAESQFGSES